MTQEVTHRVSYLYESIIDIAVKIDITLSERDKEMLISLLLSAVAKAPEDKPCLFLQSAINYIRATGE